VEISCSLQTAWCCSEDMIQHRPPMRFGLKAAGQIHKGNGFFLIFSLIAWTLLVKVMRSATPLPACRMRDNLFFVQVNVLFRRCDFRFCPERLTRLCYRCSGGFQFKERSSSKPPAANGFPISSSLES